LAEEYFKPWNRVLVCFVFFIMFLYSLHPYLSPVFGGPDPTGRPQTPFLIVPLSKLLATALSRDVKVQVVLIAAVQLGLFFTFITFWHVNVTQRRNNVFKVGGPVPWSRVLLPFYRKKLTGLHNRLHNHTLFIRKPCRTAPYTEGLSGKRQATNGAERLINRTWLNPSTHQMALLAHIR